MKKLLSVAKIAFEGAVLALSLLGLYYYLWLIFSIFTEAK